MAESFPHERLEEIVRRHVPSADTLRFSPPPGGKHNSTYLVEGANRPLVLRISPDPTDDASQLFYERRMMRQEPELHGLLRERSRAPVPEIVAHGIEDPVLDRDFLLMERLPGSMLGSPGGDASRTLRELGAALRSVHEIRRAEYGYVGAHRPMDPASTWGDAFEMMWGKLLDDIVGVGGYGTDEGARLRSLLAANRSLFDHDPPSCLLHMDVWSENILAAPSGELTGLIDWDRALWGDPEIEFAVLDYCGISSAPFWEGYGSSGDPRSADEEAMLRRAFYWLYEHQKYIFIRIARRNDPGAAASYRRQSLEVAAQIPGWPRD